MKQSEKIENLAKALCKFQSQMEAITKDATNPFYKSKYATLDAIWSAIRKPLTDNELSVTQLPDEDGLTTVLLHTSGEYISSTAKIHMGNKPQEQGSAYTYMRRYALSAILGLVTDEDDDANSTNHKCVKCERTDTRVISIKGKDYSVCPMHLPQ